MSVLALLFASTWQLPLVAQGDKWNELYDRVSELYKEGKYTEAIPVAEEALRVAESTFGPEDTRIAGSLNKLAEVFRKQGEYAKAETFYKRSLAIREKVLGPEHPAVAETLDDLGALYTGQGRIPEAEPLLKRALAIREKVLGLEHPDVAMSLEDLADVAYVSGDFQEAEPLLKRALAIREKALGPEHPDVAQSLTALAEDYLQEARYAEAEPLLKRARAIQEKALGPDHPDVAETLKDLGELSINQGHFPEAESFLERALAIREKALGPEHPDVADPLGDLAQVYDDEAKYGQAEPLYKRALAIHEKALGPDNRNVATDLNNLANLYVDQGRYADAEPLYKRAVAIDEKALGADHPEVAVDLSNLAELYRKQGKYADAEPLYRRSLAIFEKVLGSDHPDVAVELNNLAALYDDQGKYAEAELLYRRTLAIDEKALGADHPGVATDLNNLALLYQEQGKYADAEPFYKRALAIREKALGPEHPDVAQSLNNLAELYERQGKYADAEPLYKRSLAIFEKVLGPDHPSVATDLNNLANVYEDQGKYADAEPLFWRSLAIREKVLGPDHPLVATSLNNLALLFYAQDRFPAASPLFDRGLDNLSKQFEYYFSYMSEKDRLSFLATVQLTFPVYYSFCFANNQQHPEVLGRMYDTVLWQKGFIASSVSALRARIVASGEKESLTLLDKLTAKKAQLATLLTSQPTDREEWRRRVEQLEQESNDLEKQLVARSSAMAESKKLQRVTWQDVQKSLKPEEAAVEIVRFKFNDGKRWTGKTYYIALIVTPQSKMPALVNLGDAADIEKAPMNDYRKRAGLERNAELADKPGFYETFWKPLEPALADVKRIYFSPDGVLNQVAPGIIPADNDQLLMEKYELRILNSTKDILRAPVHSPSNTAMLIGNPKFDLSVADQQVVLNNLQPSQNSNVLVAANVTSEPIMRGLTLSLDDAQPILAGQKRVPPLPGTGAEVQAIFHLLDGQHWQVGPPLTGDRALEEEVKQVRHPRLLHIATHGFFLLDRSLASVRSDSSQEKSPPVSDDPMLRSGLLFAGAERFFEGQQTPEGMESGVLTAYETSGLDLQGTELVVLSACETGLGQQQNGEGVFGLRRALQEAGAESVMMTMWSVPDKETQELMTLFYKNWLSGVDKPEALRKAQLEERDVVKQRYGHDDPYYWGAFVLVGR
ncbi:MAG: tetratricopeptide repeat protein [Candidatus Acidiferrales bacterium]